MRQIHEKYKPKPVLQYIERDNVSLGSVGLADDGSLIVHISEFKDPHLPVGRNGQEHMYVLRAKIDEAGTFEHDILDYTPIFIDAPFTTDSLRTKVSKQEIQKRLNQFLKDIV